MYAIRLDELTKDYAVGFWRKRSFRALDRLTLDVEPGDSVTFDHVLLAGDGSDDVKVGTPIVDGASVKAEVIRHGRGDKVIVFKRKRRKGYRKKQGHRQNFTEIRIDEVVA